MCTSIVEIVPAEGAGKLNNRWFPLTQAVVAYDHSRHALFDDGIAIDFVNAEMGPGTRTSVELSLDTAKALSAALIRAIEAAELEEAGRGL